MKQTKKELRRVLSKFGVCSKTQAEPIIREGRVVVNGEVILDPLTPVLLTDHITLDGEILRKAKPELYAFNKPKGVITTTSEKETRPKVLDYMPDHTYLFPVGRLDKASRGLLLFTNDNEFGNYILAPETKVPKTYRVQVRGKFLENHIHEMERGVFIDKIRNKAEKVRVIKANPGSTWIEVELMEGKNREIRNMLETLGYTVLELVRVQIGKLKLRKLNLQPGQYTRVRKEDIV